ncbi:MAG: OFA family MFS transporter [Treponema sp.]|nr:OFA family MFS transporter [Treponema sp.]
MNKRQGIFAVLAAVAIQLIIGVAYLWSLFQTGIANSLFDGDNAAAGLTFSLLLATLTIGSVFAGKLDAKYSTRVVVFAGGIILSLGFFLASFVTERVPWLLWITYGVMGGFGMGFTYATTIACAQKWFPHKKGFVTGIIVSALGFGGVVFAFVIEGLINAFGGPGTREGLGGEPMTFRVLSVVFLMICTIGSLFLKTPPAPTSTGGTANVAAKATANYMPREMLKTPQFYLLTGTLLVACIGGLMMINFARPIAVAKGLEATAATIAVLVISIFNSVGRVIWGIISDKIGRLNTIIILLSGSAILSLFVTVAVVPWIYVLIAFIGFFYGGLLSNFPSLTADTFGTKYMSYNYGIVLLGFGTGAIIASQVAGRYNDLVIGVGDIRPMFPAFMIASACAIAGIIMMLFFKKINRRTKI